MMSALHKSASCEEDHCRPAVLVWPVLCNILRIFAHHTAASMILFPRAAVVSFVVCSDLVYIAFASHAQTAAHVTDQCSTNPVEMLSCRQASNVDQPRCAAASQSTYLCFYCRPSSPLCSNGRESTSSLSSCTASCTSCTSACGSSLPCGGELSESARRLKPGEALGSSPQQA